MRVLLLIILLVNASAAAAWAKAYSCSDSAGRTHFSDNLQGLPEDCRDEAKKVGSGNTGNLNYVPDPQIENSEIEYKHSVRAVEREEQQRDQLARQLHHRAEALREQYRQAVAEKWQAKTGWSNNKRKQVKAANDKLLRILENKQQLSSDLDTAKVPTRDKDAIRKILAELDEDINAE